MQRQDVLLKELLAGRLQLSVVAAVKSAGTVPHRIPGVVAGHPGEGRPKRVKHVKEGPAQDHIVVRGKHEGDDNSGEADTCKNQSQKLVSLGNNTYSAKLFYIAGKNDIISHL